MKVKKRMRMEVTTSLTLSRSLGLSREEGVVEACAKGSTRKTQTLLELKAHRTSAMRTVEGADEVVIVVAAAGAEVAEEAMEITIKVVVAMVGAAMEIITGVEAAMVGVVEAVATTVEARTAIMIFIAEVVEGTTLGLQETH